MTIETKELAISEELKRKVEMLGSNYKLNYYEVIPDEDFSDISFISNVDIEKIVRIILIKDNKKYKDDKLKLGIITIDLSDIKAPNGEQLYKGFFEKFKEMSDNELCNI